ncbi:NitT/TauT family transport system permease protein [Caldalkalibacillus uzonensis]|uniref:NitT/TauT family transport system permease protein n=1 Tax=Caldalkalibacillus uzonensis TaxID=353224 RepID=A0ABU0CLZ6_9BACI|nr:ABC transporter permease [Caldalkalibacillus uzonensis]MDQ0337430.1 NitT/TauT family transport system permease protein [Caldalkalibacillus uzonensis]
MKKPSFYSLLLFVGIIGIWEWIVYACQIRPLILPAPSAIFAQLITQLLNGYFWPHIWATLLEIIGGFILGSIMGIGLGFLIAQSDTVRNIIQPYLIASQAMPKLALAPLLATWFGFGYEPKIIIVALICFFPLLESTITGLTFVDQERLELFRSLRASKRQTLLKLRLPTAVPYIFSGLRVAVVLSVVGAVVSEFVGANKGLGALIISAQYDTTLIFSAFILLTLMGLFLYEGIHWTEKLLFKKYHHSRREWR